jgi:uncharacterized protein YneF (UPF0154 family)
MDPVFWFPIVYVIVAAILFFIGGYWEWFDDGELATVFLILVWPLCVVAGVIVGPFYGLKALGEYLKNKSSERKWKEMQASIRESEQRYHDSFFS